MTDKRGTRLADDWTLPDGWDKDLPRLGFTPRLIETTADEFKDYWIAVPGKGGIKLNWQATWRNWCRRTADRLRLVPKHDPQLKLEDDNKDKQDVSRPVSTGAIPVDQLWPVPEDHFYANTDSRKLTPEQSTQSTRLRASFVKRLEAGQFGDPPNARLGQEWIQKAMQYEAIFPDKVKG